MDKNTVLIAVGLVFRDHGENPQYFLVKVQDSEDWEMPKILVRKGESSVHAILRTMGERGGMTTRVLDEAGRANGVQTTNHKTVTQKFIYYLMFMKQPASNPGGFGEFQWLDYQKAAKKLASKKDVAMLKTAKEMIKEWKKKRKNRKLHIETE